MLRLISAHPRSGQNYISRVMYETGLNMGIAYRRSDGSKFYKDDPPMTDGAVAFMRPINDIDVTLHQVREPLKTISSSTTEPAGTFRLIFSVLHKRPKGEAFNCYKCSTSRFHKILRVNPLLPMWTWLHLNEFIEKTADYRYRIEDIDSEYPKICELFKVEPKQSVPDIPRNFNTREHNNWTWLDLMSIDSDLTERIMEKAQEYGYDIH